MNNIYMPELMEVIGIQQHTADVKSVKIRFQDAAAADRFTFRVGQFGMFSAFGAGESTFNICSLQLKDHIDSASARPAKTECLWQINEGDTIASGPLRQQLSQGELKARIDLYRRWHAMPPIRCAIWYAMENRAVRRHHHQHGARTAADFVFADELDQWAQVERTRVVRCVDPGGETPDWKYEVGLIPHVIERAAIPAENSIALVVGPPIMIKFTLPVLDKMGLGPGDIYTSLENRMKCGVGKCGRCNCGPVYVCKEGPIFTLEQLNQLPLDY